MSAQMHQSAKRYGLYTNVTDSQLLIRSIPFVQAFGVRGMKKLEVLSSAKPAMGVVQ